MFIYKNNVKERTLVTYIYLISYRTAVTKMQMF